MSRVHSVANSSDSSSSLSSDDEPKRRPSKDKRIVKTGSAGHLDSNGESDEEVDRLHRILKEKSHELDEEKQTAKKLKQLIKNLRKENKLLHSRVKEEKEEPRNSDSDNPPWERRKLESQLQERDKLVQEKNFHIQQLLNDCQLLEKDNKACHNEIQTLTRQFNECTSQLHQAAESYSLLEQKFKDRVVYLEEENRKIKLQLSECQLQKLRNEENLDRISEAVDATVDKCREIISGKEKIIEELEAKMLIYASSGTSDKDEEIRRLRSELQAASEDLEQSARLLEQIQGSASPKGSQQGKKTVSRSILKKLRKYDQLKQRLKENEEVLTERDQQVAELKKLLNRYESGTYGLAEAIKELREAREQLTIRDRQIEDLVQQSNLLETKAEDILMENDDLREKLGMDSRQIDLPMKRKTLTKQLEDCHQEIRVLTDRNIELGLQNQCLKRVNRRPEDQETVTDGKVKEAVETDIFQDYRSACSEVIVLRKGLMEILASVREQDGRSDVKIQSPILERLIAVLNCERLFGHYDAYADFMSEFNALQGENRILRERVRELKAAPAVSTTPQPIAERKISMNGIDQAVQASDVNNTLTVDVATDPVFPDVDVDKPVLVKETLQKRPVAVQVTDSFDLGVRVEQYEEKLSDLEQQLKRVKCELQILTDKYQHEQTDWNRKTADWIDELSAKNKRLEELENELKVQETLVQELEMARQQQKADVNTDSVGSEDLDTKRVMEKEMFTLKIRLEHKEQTLKRYQQLLDELRVEQLNTIELHSQEVLNLQDTILDQQRSLYKVEQTQREIAASAASSRVVVRHLESEVGTVHQMHNQVVELKNQLDVVHKQAAQWKQAAEALSREKRLLKESLESDHQLIVDQLKNHWDTSQTEVKELRDQMANMKRELLEERYDKQRSTLLHVLVTKLKTELDKKEKQMEFLKHVAQELHSRISCDDKSSSSNESPILDPTDNDEVIKLEEMINSLKQEIVQLEKTVDNQKKQMQSRQAEIQNWRTKYDEQSKLTEKLQAEKTAITRQMVSLRSRVTRLSGERTAAQNNSEDLCRLLRRIKELESQLAMFHQAEKPVCDEAQQQRNVKFDEWKERKKMQATIDGLKVKLRSLQNRLDDEERYKENLRKTINRLVSEKRSLEEKLKFKANDNERMHRLIEENTQWRNRFEILEHRLREMSDDESSTDRHRLQISVLQDRLKKQEEQIAQLESQATHTSTRHAAKAAIEQLHRENVALKILSQRVLVVGPKMIENIQRLDNLVHMDVRPSERGSERRVSIQEGPPMPDIRRTVKNLHQLVNKLLESA